MPDPIPPLLAPVNKSNAAQSSVRNEVGEDHSLLVFLTRPRANTENCPHQGTCGWCHWKNTSLTLHSCFVTRCSVTKNRIGRLWMQGTYRIVSGQLTIGHNVETILKPARSHIPWPPNLVHGPFSGPKSTQIADIENPQNVAVVTVVRGQRHWNCWAVQLETSRVHRVELPSWQCNCQADLHPRYDYMRSLAHHSSSSAAIFSKQTIQKEMIVIFYNKVSYSP